MSDHIDVPTASPPSLSKLATTTAVALVIAAAILVTLVLPAEYSIDPLGTGRVLGLTDIASPPLTPVELSVSRGARLAPVQSGPIGEYPAEFKYDVFEMTLQGYEYVEYKYHLEQGAALFYAWAATAPVIHDFHGEREGVTDSNPTEQSFDKRDRQRATGSFTAPFTGIHGWYWENPGGDPIRVRLTSSGFYGAAVEIRSDRTRHPRTLRALESLAPAPAAEPNAGSSR